ncbi:MAG: MotA/TolQ/ExbB proton channel family protein [Anaeromyxobacter sp.]|nr:MotA/TolQ/ExbB proton channel family protein [Anaeromyxobacter sp.]MBL0275516.1 MotA/TolQ/ExbB proton channel family protein [Anaeromyxobacter sp.]
MDQNLASLLKTSVSLWVIAACSVLAVAAAIERAFALWAFGDRARALADAVGRALFRGDLDDARAQCERSPSAAADVFLAALVALAPRATPLAGRPAPEPGYEKLAAAVERERQRTVLRLRRGLWVLATIGATAPFVGLFGTVVGIMAAFQQMAATGQGGFAVVAAGISEALITTAAGIAVAVLAVVLFNALNTWTQRLTLQLRLLTEEYLELVKELLPTLRAAPPAGRSSAGEG